ncbi:MAG: CRTAC1 family protein [Candidatus Latescibacteria bacterium]|nr:CRTAC1 family protein [Candidatus Latescibacterota bacterium]
MKASPIFPVRLDKLVLQRRRKSPVLVWALWLAMLVGCSDNGAEKVVHTGGGEKRSKAALFVELGLQAGLVKSHTGGGPDKDYIVEAKGGGSALLDYDGDGRLDIYWVNGALLETPAEGAGNVLYRNVGGQFADSTAAAGVAGAGWGMGASSADYDNDGDADLYVTALQENLLYRNDGGVFTEVAAQAGVPAPRWSTGTAWGDVDLDGDLDLYVAHYIDFKGDQVRPLGTQWKGAPAFIGPLGLAAAADIFYRNEGDGTFSDATAAAGLANVLPGYGLGVLCVDTDLDGDSDLYVANDSSPNFLFRNGGGRFVEGALGAGVAVGEMGNDQAGMGVAWGDFDGDAQADLLVTNFEDDYNTLYRNKGDGTFVDVSFAVGLGRSVLPWVGFGAAFLDFDNDADLDLMVANGHVYPQVDAAGTGSSYAQANMLFANQGGRFTLALPAGGDSLGAARVSRGAVVGDFDDDGGLDIFVAQLNEPPVLLKNTVPSRGHWLGLRLRGTVANRDAVGARVELAAGGIRQVRHVVAGSSFLSSEDRRLHFGLGPTAKVDSLVVHWPGGGRQVLVGLAVDRYWRLEEGARPSPVSP